MVHSRSGDEAGFTLLEVIVAFVVLSMVLGSAMLSVSYASRLHRKADEIAAASQLAERLIAETFDVRPGQPDRDKGVDSNGLAWTIERRVVADAFTPDGKRLMEFRLQILDRNQQALQRYSTLYVEQNP